MPVRERVVGVEVAVARRMVRAFDRLAPGPGAARHAGDEELRLGEPERQQRHGGEQDRRGEAARMRDVRRGRFRQMLGHGAGELREARRRAVRVLVHGCVRIGARIAIVRGDVDDARLRSGLFRGRQQTVDERGGGTVRRRAEDRARRQLRHERGDFGERAEARFRIGAREMAEGLRHGLAGLAVRQDGSELELRMTRDQAQQLTGHVAGAAEHDRGDACVRHLRRTPRCADGRPNRASGCRSRCRRAWRRR